MNDDGLGSSRLLLTDELARQFPEGYLVALPDRSCGLAISKRLGWNEHREVEAMVADMHKGATTPMCSDVREPRELLPRAANKRLKLPGGDRSKGSGVLCPAGHEL